MKSKISIVIPVYNAENYLSECIESIINQTIGFENIQLILVNDGSTDNSKKIIDDYCNKYSNIEAYHLEKSHKIGGFARNVGIKHATGEYLMFVDSDDYISDTACEKMYKTITENEADIVTANYKCMNEDGKIWDKPIFDDERCKSGELKEVNQDFFYLFCPSVCLKIFNNDLIKKYNIGFLGKVPAEDAYFSCSAFLKSKKVYYLSDVIYYYRRRNTGTMSTSWMRNKKYFLGVNFAFKEIYKLFEKENRLEDYKYFYAKNLLSLIYKFIDTKLLSNEERIELIDEMNWFFKQSERFNIVLAQNSIEILLKNLINKDYEKVSMLCEVISEMRLYMTEEQKEMMTKPRKITI